jgi:hypothetical protein
MIDNGFPSETDIPLEVAETYQLTTEERDALLRATEFETSLKLRIYELQTQLEAAQRELIGAGAQGRGARAMLVQTRGWKDAILSDDLATLTRRK